MDNLQRYPKYKDSGEVWLGEVPESWDIRRIKFLFKIGRGRVISQQELVDDGKYPVYSSQTQDNGVLGRINTYDFDCQQITWTTDGVNAGTVFLRDGKHNCTNVCGTLQPKIASLSMEFLAFALTISTQFYKRPDTNGAKIMNGEMAEIIVTVPPLSEQTRIAQFLDQKTAQIDQAIAQKERLIELLKERRQILIHNAVTRGLNREGRMKDSGVEWIGMVPEGWEVKKLKNILKSQGRIGFKGYAASDLVSEDEGALTLGATHLDWEGAINLSEPVYISWKKYYESPEIMVSKGDIIIVQRGSTCGKVALIKNELGPTTINPSLVLLKEILEQPEFVFLGIKVVLNGILNLVSTTAIPMLTQFQINNIIIPVPPKSEQAAISKYVKNGSQKIDTAIACKQSEIEKLKEYKATLINSAVTGKIEIL